MGLGDPPIVRGGDHVCRQAEVPQDAARAGGLVPGNANPQAHSTKRSQYWTGVGVQVTFPEPLRFAHIGPLLPGLLQVKPRLENLEGLPVVLAAGYHCAEHRREDMTRDTQPVRPRPVLPCLIH